MAPPNQQQKQGMTRGRMGNIIDSQRNKAAGKLNRKEMAKYVRKNGGKIELMVKREHQLNEWTYELHEEDMRQQRENKRFKKMEARWEEEEGMMRKEKQKMRKEKEEMRKEKEEVRREKDVREREEYEDRR